MWKAACRILKERVKLNWVANPFVANFILLVNTRVQPLVCCLFLVNNCEQPLVGTLSSDIVIFKPEV